MDIKGTISAIIAATVCVIVVVAVAIPIVANLGDEVNTAVWNDNISFFATDKDADNDIEIKLIEGDIYTNGVKSVELEGSGRMAIAISDTFAIYCAVGSASMFLLTDDQTTQISTVNISGNTWAAGNKTGTFTELIYADPNGNYGSMFFSGVQPTFSIDDGKTAYVFISANVGSSDYNISCKLSDGNQTNYAISAGATYNAAAEMITDNGISAEWSISNKITVGESENAVGVTVFAPKMYHVVTPADDAIISIINVVPLLMIVGIIVAVAAVFIRTR